MSTIQEPEDIIQEPTAPQAVGRYALLFERLAARLGSATPRLAWLVLAIGVLLRAGRYLHNPTLWLDELWLAINITERSWEGLKHPLAYLQAAPVGFLIAEKAATTTVGDSEYALRAIPFTSSIAGLFLFHHVARRVLSPRAALLALVLFATSPVVLFQSAQAKPYSTDVAFGLLLVLLGLRAQGSGPSWRGLWPLALAAPVALIFSFPAILVLGSVCAMLLAESRLRDVGGSLRVAALAATSLAVFGVLYAIQAPNVSRTATAILGTSGIHSGSSSRPRTVLHDAWSTFVDPGGFQTGENGLAVLLYLVGLLSYLRRRDLARLALLVSPFALAAFADLLGKYPLGGRVSLFLVPYLVIVVADGASEVVSAIRFAPELAAGLLVLFLVASPVTSAARDLFASSQRDEVKPLLRVLAREARRGDTLYLSQDAQYAVRYYSTCADCNPPGRTFPWPIRRSPLAPAAGQFAPAIDSGNSVVVGGHDASAVQILHRTESLWSRPRVWFLFVHLVTFEEQLEQRVIASEIRRRGRLVEQHSDPGATLFLYEPRAVG